MCVTHSVFPDGPAGVPRRGAKVSIRGLFCEHIIRIKRRGGLKGVLFGVRILERNSFATLGIFFFENSVVVLEVK